MANWLSRTALVFVFLVSVSPPLQAAGWKLVFSDDFDGPSLDRNRWATRMIYENETLDHLKGELERYDDNSHRLADGALALTAQKKGELFSSGMIRSRQTFYYGYFEARVKLPSARGVWPAFWLNPDYDNMGRLTWPPEIDIFEYALNKKDDRDEMIHSDISKGPPGFGSEILYSDPRFSRRFMSYFADEPLYANWHTFGLLWRPDRVTIYMDGKELYTKEFHWVTQGGELAGPAHIIFNLAVGGSWAGRYGVDEGSFPQELLIDYVRVCQFTIAQDGEETCAGSPFTPNPRQSAYEAPHGDLPKPTFGEAQIWSEIRQANTDIQPGSKIRITPVITGNVPPGASLSFAFRSPDARPEKWIAEKSVGSPNENEAVSFHIGSLASGEYDLVAILRRESLGEWKPIPVVCDSQFESIKKALSCKVGTVVVGR